jgi:hypothetical protein
MQSGAYEAIYLGRPVITSDFAILRQAFDKGSVFVGNSPDEVASGITRMRSDLQRYQREAQALRLEKLAQWRRIEGNLRTLLWGATDR